jgi:1-acyl-sn-glycerol-3-phosphate acyltransferase
LYKGHTGVARLALQCGVPVIAVAMIGTSDVQQIGQVMPRLFMPVTIRISKPMRFDRYADRASDPTTLRRITDEIMFELRELSGQEYVNSYAVRKGSVEAADPAHVKTLEELAPATVAS